MDITIDELVVECNISGYSADTDKLVSDSEVFVRTRFLPVIESILVELGAEFDLLRLNQAEIQINVDQISGTDIFPEQIPSTPLRALLRKEILKGAKDGRPSRSSPVVADVWNMFHFIISEGYRPWQFSYTTHEEFEKYLSANFSLARGGGQKAGKLRDLLKQKAARERLSRGFSFEFITALLLNLFNDGNNQEDFVSDLELIVSSLKIKDDFDRKYFLLSLTSNSDYKYSDIIDIWNTANKGKEFISVKKIKTQFLRHALRGLVEQAADKTGAKNNMHEGSAVQEENKGAKKTTQQTIKDAFLNEDVSGANEIYVANSGLVLLAPYFGRFFEQIGQWKNGRLKNPSQCVYLLQLLSGVSEIRDYDLALNKVLCGLEPGENIKPFKKFTKKQISEAKVLLKAAIANWSALKQTSPEGLQFTFLQRDGKLQITPDFGLLEVERRTEDVLLDYIPWTFGMIKLPWMKYLLKVNW